MIKIDKGHEYRTRAARRYWWTLIGVGLIGAGVFIGGLLVEALL